MLRQLFFLMAAMTLLTVTTLVGYANWASRWRSNEAYLRTATGGRTPSAPEPPSGFPDPIRPRRTTGGGRRRTTHGFRVLRTNSTDSWGCDVSRQVKPRSDQWQQVIANSTYVYSAYLDQRSQVGSVVVRLFGIISTRELSNKTRPFYCMLMRQYEHVAMVMEGDIVLIGRPRSSYVAFQFQCRIDTGAQQFSFTTVSMATERCTLPNNGLQIRNAAIQRQEREFTVCLSGPLKHQYNSVYQFVEWIELNRILGADLFYLYVYSVGSDVASYIRYYQLTELIRVVPWTVPISLDFNPEEGHEFHTFEKLWNYGQETMIQDCLYRNMYATKYVVFLDLDELIVPRGPQPATWSQMIRSSGCDDDVTAVYLARNAFFVPEDEPGRDGGASKFSTSRRQDLIYRVYDRSKYIARPELVTLPYIHKVLVTLDQTDQCVLSPDVGLLHHYRLPPKKAPLLTDHTLSKYKKRLVQNQRHLQRQVRAMYTSEAR